MRLLLMMVVVACASRQARACAVPVFQYAMQNWPPDDYTLIVAHRGPLDAPHRDLLESWQQSSAFLDANLQIRLVDLDSDDRDASFLLPSLEDAQLPYAILRYPEHHKGPMTVWQGPLDHADWKQLCTSPLRRRIADRLMRGDTAVWVLLESGHRAQDDRAAALLDDHLEYLEETLVPGEQPESPLGDVPQTELESDDIPVRFSVLRLKREDEAEHMLVRMLLRSEADLEDEDAPMVFPIFGRGRALYALVGGGIEPSVITKAGAFLVGGCSCVVKVQNPGTDLLISRDWEEPIEEAAFVALPESTSTENVGGSGTRDRSAEPGDDSVESAPPLWRNAATGLVLGVAVVALVGYLLMRRGHPV